MSLQDLFEAPLQGNTILLHVVMLNSSLNSCFCFFQGILQDVEHRHFWLKDLFGQDICEDIKDAEILLRSIMSAPGVPKLIPIYNGLFMPSLPHATGNCIFSVCNSSISIRYNNLYQFLETLSFHRAGRYTTFNLTSTYPIFSQPRPPPFWIEFVKVGLFQCTF